MDKTETEMPSSISRIIDKYKDFIKTKDASVIFYGLLVFLLVITIIGFRSQNLTFNITLLIFASLYIAAIYLCISLGLSMTYKLLDFANFAHAEYFIIGAYTAIMWNMINDYRDPVFMDIFIVIVLGFIAAGLVAILGDILVFKPLRKLNSSSETLMISSIGWGIIIRNVVSVFFGAGVVYFRWVETKNILIKSVRVGGADFSTSVVYGLNVEYLIAILVTIFMVIALFYVLAKTKMGKALRATSDNISLAESSGIKTDRMINITWFIGGGLAGVSGVLFGLSSPIFPTSGFIYLLPAFAVVVLGGIGSLKGSVVAAVIIAFSQNLSVSYLSWLEGPLDRSGLIAYQRVLPFVILIIVILIKPQGLYGGDLDE